MQLFTHASFKTQAAGQPSLRALSESLEQLRGNAQALKTKLQAFNKQQLQSERETSLDSALLAEFQRSAERFSQTYTQTIEAWTHQPAPKLAELGDVSAIAQHFANVESVLAQLLAIQNAYKRIVSTELPQWSDAQETLLLKLQSQAQVLAQSLERRKPN
jgi:hypothetical protein